MGCGCCKQKPEPSGEDPGLRSPAAGAAAAATARATSSKRAALSDANLQEAMARQRVEQLEDFSQQLIDASIAGAAVSRSEESARRLLCDLHILQQCESEARTQTRMEGSLITAGSCIEGNEQRMWWSMMNTFGTHLVFYRRMHELREAEEALPWIETTRRGVIEASQHCECAFTVAVATRLMAEDSARRCLRRAEWCGRAAGHEVLVEARRRQVVEVFERVARAACLRRGAAGAREVTQRVGIRLAEYSTRGVMMDMGAAVQAELSLRLKAQHNQDKSRGRLSLQCAEGTERCTAASVQEQARGGVRQLMLLGGVEAQEGEGRVIGAGEEVEERMVAEAAAATQLANLRELMRFAAQEAAARAQLAATVADEHHAAVALLASLRVLVVSRVNVRAEEESVRAATEVLRVRWEAKVLEEAGGDPQHMWDFWGRRRLHEHKSSRQDRRAVEQREALMAQVLKQLRLSEQGERRGVATEEARVWKSLRGGEMCVRRPLLLTMPKQPPPEVGDDACRVRRRPSTASHKWSTQLRPPYAGSGLADWTAMRRPASAAAAAQVRTLPPVPTPVTMRAYSCRRTPLRIRPGSAAPPSSPGLSSVTSRPDTSFASP
eukprot:TRINITY_DN21155_c0_g1_i1.p1 TRINITY_DN21155_c0_g1~~TRINITY_DN21155_c0_g1_i1.p1  ORF type:complete len:608 (+),score=188.12 TRINITY_DN21155_c0_g1_i1:54-1877(+)